MNSEKILINGELKTKISKKKRYIIVTVLILVFLLSIWMLIGGLSLKNIELILGGICGIFFSSYLFNITPSTQKSKDYYIEFEDNKSLANFKLFYKSKLVELKYKLDEEGKFMFLENQNKLNCISYADESRMKNLVKYKILNYFGQWLMDNQLMSEQVSRSIEKM